MALAHLPPDALPREIFTRALELGAANATLALNHPTGMAERGLL